MERGPIDRSTGPWSPIANSIVRCQAKCRNSEPLRRRPARVTGAVELLWSQATPPTVPCDRCVGSRRLSVCCGTQVERLRTPEAVLERQHGLTTFGAVDDTLVQVHDEAVAGTVADDPSAALSGTLDLGSGEEGRRNRAVPHPGHMIAAEPLGGAEELERSI